MSVYTTQALINTYNKAETDVSDKQATTRRNQISTGDNTSQPPTWRTQRARRNLYAFHRIAFLNGVRMPNNNSNNFIVSVIRIDIEVIIAQWHLGAQTRHL